MQPRLIHAHFGRGGALALPIARALGSRWSSPSMAAMRPKTRPTESRLFPTVFQRRYAALQREAALIVCVAEHIREALLARDFPAAKLKVIRYGVEAGGGWRDAVSRRTRPYLLFVGRFVEKREWHICSKPCEP